MDTPFIRNNIVILYYCSNIYFKLTYTPCLHYIFINFNYRSELIIETLEPEGDTREL